MTAVPTPADKHVLAQQAVKALEATFRAVDRLGDDVEIVIAAGDVLNVLRVEVVNALSERRTQAVRRLQGSMTLDEIARATGLSRQRIHQMVER
jgi:phytoene/squalene synthetase